MKNNSRIELGIIFILIGVGALLSSMNYLNHNGILLMISLVFFAFYFLRGGNKYYNNIGLLIPACILLVLAPIDIIRGRNAFYKVDDQIAMLAIAIAFFLIYVIHNMWVKDIRNRKRHWPLFLAIILAVVSISNYLSDVYDVAVGDFFRQYSWGILLIMLGIYILIKEVFKKKI
jgi:hypothetical protein